MDNQFALAAAVLAFVGGVIVTVFIRSMMSQDLSLKEAFALLNRSSFITIPITLVLNWAFTN